MRRSLFLLALLLPLGGARVSGDVGSPRAGAPPVLRGDSVPDANRIRNDLRRFAVIGTVLHVGAHPDDENTQLIAYAAHGRAFRTAYLSVTRGDGGQNLLGPQLGPLLGVARTQELLAARRVDGGRQFFTRAIDYGFSKDVREALGVWGHEQVLGDVVRVIREFRPDVIVTRFSPQPGGTHGHHTASAVLALEAFKLAGDSTAYPEQLRTLRPWQPRRIFVNAGASGTPPADAAGVVRMDIGGVDPVLGRSFANVAAESRGMHKTQGFGQLPVPPAGAGNARVETFVLLAGEPVRDGASDIMAGVDTTWNRVPGGERVAQLSAAALAAFDAARPWSSVPALVQIRKELNRMPASSLVSEKRVLLDSIIQNSLGLAVTTRTGTWALQPGDTLRLQHSAAQASPLAVRWLATRYPAGAASTGVRVLTNGASASRTGTYVLPVSTPPTQPYWLRLPAATGFYTVADSSLIGRPEDPPVVAVQHVFEVYGEQFVVEDRPVMVQNGGARELAVVAPVALEFNTVVGVLRPGTTREIGVRVTAAKAPVSGSVRLEAPNGWTVTPTNASFTLARAADTALVRFTVRAPAAAAEGELHAVAEVGGKRWDEERIAIDYPHIPLQLLQPHAALRVASVQLETRGQRVGYVPGAGDDVPDALRQMGYAVTELAAADITPEKLARFDAVVLGIRILNVRADLETVLPALFDYARAGGTVIEQYSQTGAMPKSGIAPYALTISRERVTNEDAPITFLAPQHPVLNSPNRITAADFRGWVQEQGTYYAGQWDAHFTPIVASSDAGEKPLEGGLLVAPVGEGYWIYTGLAFFRQLPAGVPGAYRLFANLVSLGN